MPKTEISITGTAADENRGYSIRISGNDGGKADVLLQESSLGHKPHAFEHASGSLFMACVGHVYAKLAKTFAVEESLPILADAFLRGGADGLRDAIGGGMFSIFVIDRTARRCLCLTDFLACMPLFYRRAQDGFLVGINQFDIAHDVKPSPLACAEYLSYGYLPYHQSLFPDVHRLGPGQVLTVPLGAIDSFEVSDERYPAYPALDDRISDEEEAVDRVDALLSKYFSRLGDEPIAAGLSGGYDSRLIAAYCRNKRFSPVTYDNPQTKEADFASRVAEVLGLRTNVFRIPADAPSRYARDFYYGMSALDSLESSHVFGNLDTLNRNGPAYIIDGHIGDVVFGGGFYSKLKMRNEPLLKYVTGTDAYSAPPQSDDVYLNRMASGYGRKIDVLSREAAERLEAHTKDRLAQLITKLRTTCSTDADIMEMTLHVFRGASLAASGPVTFMRKAATLCPFYDVEIFTTCMAISKSLRAGDRVYNAFYRRKFPELASIPKENTGGCAKQPLVLYRLTHLKNVAIRKFNKLLPVWMQRGASTGGNTDDFLNQYLDDPGNQVFFNKIIAESGRTVSGLGLMPGRDFSSMEKNKLHYLRYVSLAFLLGRNRA